MTPTTGLQSPGRGDDARTVRLSVVIACLNSVDTLADQLDALAAERPGVAWEVLVCDNGSTDGTVQLARSYAALLPLIVVDAGARRGAGAARNVGAQHARGEYLAFCDADDVIGAGWIDAMACALEEHPFVAGRFEAKRLNSRRALRSRSLDQQDGLQHSPTGPELPHAGAGNMGIRRDVFLSVGGFDPTVPCLEDTDLSWRVQLSGAPLTYVPEAVVHVRLRSSLRQMFRQGRDYGRAHAFLERRYGRGGATVDDVPGPVDVAAPTTLAATAAGAMAGQVAATVASQAAGPAEAVSAGGAAGGVAAAAAVAGGVVASSGGRGLREVARAWLGDRPSLSRVIWQLGWHRGYRRGALTPTPIPAQTAEV